MYGYHITKHPVLSERMVCLWNETGHVRRAEIRLLPGFGSNLCSYCVDGIEFLHQAPMPVIGTSFFGIPLLYPFPNRVRDCCFEFDRIKYILPDNDRRRTLHGLVADTPFQADTPVITDDQISIRTTLEINTDHALYKIFPVASRLEMSYILRDQTLLLQAKITNIDSERRLPFGFGIHPYFNIHGTKDTLEIHVPAQRWMEAVDQLPTGRLVDLARAPVDFSHPQRLAALDLDDVWYGMTPNRPLSICYKALKKRLVIRASEIFTHCVTYTPPCEAFFCIENQTCSTDSHNLHQRGLTKEAHLLILEPGENVKGEIQMQLEPL